MNILVTGGSGFIGSYVCKCLYEDGHRPIIFDHTYHGPDSLAFQLGGPIHLGDVRDANAVNEAVAHVDGVIHLAAILGSQETVANPKPAVDTNINGAINVMESCTQWNVPMVMTTVGNGWL